MKRGFLVSNYLGLSPYDFMELPIKISTPPPSNRGVLRTDDVPLISLVDWLQVTFKENIETYKICDLIGLDFEDFTHIEDSGKYGYSSHYRFGHISIYYSNTRIDKHLEITGQGCREFEKLSIYNWISLFGLLLMFDINITRLDLAIDDYKGYLNLTTIKNKVKKVHLTSLFRESRVLTKYDLKDGGGNAGETIYFGSPSSSLQIRMYDKKAERKNVNVKVKYKHWIRTELQMRGDRAKIAAEIIVSNNSEDIGDFIKGVLTTYIRFTIPRKDTNSRRWKTCHWWLKFLNDVGKVKLTKVEPKATIERSSSWIENNVIQSLSTVLKAKNYDPQIIIDWILQGELKQSKKHENMINSYQALNDKYNIYDKVEYKKSELIKILYEYKKKIDPEQDQSQINETI